MLLRGGGLEDALQTVGKIFARFGLEFAARNGQGGLDFVNQTQKALNIRFCEGCAAGDGWVGQEIGVDAEFDPEIFLAGGGAFVEFGAKARERNARGREFSFAIIELPEIPPAFDAVSNIIAFIVMKSLHHVGWIERTVDRLFEKRGLGGIDRMDRDSGLRLFALR